MWRRPAGPGPVVVDIPKDVQFAKGTYYGPKEVAPRPHRLPAAEQGLRRGDPRARSR